MTQKKQKRRLGAFFSALLLTAALPSTALAAAPQIAVDDAAYSGGAFLQQNTTYIPMRDFLTFLGWSVEWDAANGKALAQKDGRMVSASPARQMLNVNGAELQVVLPVREERVYLPLRALCTMLGYSVFWDGTANAVSVCSAQSATWSDDDLYWLSRIICAEAGGESMTGQVAVGNVVLNRVASSEFPDSIYGVIFDCKDAVQFEPVSNGTVYNTPTDSAVQAAKLAMQGVNVVGKSLYFFNPSLSKGTWIVNNRSYYKTIGCHNFYL